MCACVCDVIPSTVIRLIVALSGLSNLLAQVCGSLSETTDLFPAKFALVNVKLLIYPSIQHTVSTYSEC